MQSKFARLLVEILLLRMTVQYDHLGIALVVLLFWEQPLACPNFCMVLQSTLLFWFVWIDSIVWSNEKTVRELICSQMFRGSKVERTKNPTGIDSVYVHR